MMRTADLERSAALFSRYGTLWFESAFCRGMDCGALLFAGPEREISLKSPAGLIAFFRDLEACLDEGYFLAGWLSYEAGHGFEKTLMPCTADESSQVPLAWFGAYRAPLRFSEEEVRELFEKHADLFPFNHGELSAPLFSLSSEAYTDKISRIREQIARGNVYQVNFTGRYRFSFTGRPAGLFRAIRGAQGSSCTAFVNNGEHAVLSMSPELFFRRTGMRIETIPMKGTAPRGTDDLEDELLRKKLGTCEKNRAENLMIVDLLRNDLGRICTSGTVGTEGLFQMETYPTLHQMVSTVCGTLKDGAGLADLFRALFPSGSVTGAPKIKAMQFIHELEEGPRGIYTGSLGFIMPDRDMVFNVAIRTIELHGTKGVYGTGSGIVWDSLPQEEYHECHLKARILSGLSGKDVALFETMLWSQGYLLLTEHLDRMAFSAGLLGFSWNREEAQHFLDALQDELRVSGQRFKVRFTLLRDGSFTSEREVIDHATPHALLRLCVAGERVDSSNPLAMHKTTERGVFDRYFASATEKGYDEVVFLNERGEVCEGAISSLFMLRNNRFYTPPLSSGLLPGVFRRYFLATRPSAVEKILMLQDLLDADMIYIGNSVRGLRPAIFTGDQISG
jgi:para-aminobenzoate synthetase / 4-amino-4-deoxychorismate lyase